MHVHKSVFVFINKSVLGDGQCIFHLINCDVGSLAAPSLKKHIQSWLEVVWSVAAEGLDQALQDTYVSVAMPSKKTKKPPQMCEYVCRVADGCRVACSSPPSLKQ